MNHFLSNPMGNELIDCRLAKKADEKQGKEYMVLVMITNGSIVDEVKTLSLIINACKLPLSIIMVGVGNGDFSFLKLMDSNMQELMKRCNKELEGKPRDVGEIREGGG